MNRPSHSIPLVDLGTQYHNIQEDVTHAINHVFDRGDFILGEAVEQFESEFASYCGVPFGIGVDSGLSALQLALRAYDVGPGDEVITAANTFIASALAIAETGATPVLADIDPSTFNLSPKAVEACITSRTAAILPVHLYGHPANMSEIAKIASRHGLLVIEDACQAHGALYHNQRVGSFGHAAAFSFYPGKNLGAYGDGGMIVTSDAGIVEKVRMLRNYGQSTKYNHVIKGHNHRLDTLQAAVLRVKLRRLEDWNAARRRIAEAYAIALAKDVVVPRPELGVTPVWHLYVIRVRERAELVRYLNWHGVSSGIHYPIPIHLQPAFADLNLKQGAFPVTEAFAEEILSLPMYPELSLSQVEYISGVIHQFQPGLGIKLAA